MLFSDTFELGNVGGKEWFDPVLSVDTELFLDPFLIYDNEQGIFVGAHDEIVEFFNSAFLLIARSGGNQKSYDWRRAERLLLFPEVEELCLGYTAQGTGGLGSGKDLAKRIAIGLWKAIEQGIEEIRHFEQVQIFQEGIGPDRISDATAGILRHRIAAYTETACQTLKIPTQTTLYQRARFDSQQGRWVAGEFSLPRNPYNEMPIFLIPKRYIRPLPSINPKDYWTYCVENEAEILRSMFGEDISKNVNKEKIIYTALRQPETRERYLDYKEDRGSEPYDFPNDPKGFLEWYDHTKAWVKAHAARRTFSNTKEFLNFIDSIISDFRNYVENNGGWKLLWNENETPRREDAAQRLFLGIVKHQCKANNVDISSEPNIGRGPVDYKVSNGFIQKALIELKLAKNTKFWRGLEEQLPKYLEAEEAKVGRFVVIVFNDKELEKIKGIYQKVEALNKRLSYTLKAVIIDARRAPPSASLL